MTTVTVAVHACQGLTIISTVTIIITSRVTITIRTVINCGFLYYKVIISYIYIFDLNILIPPKWRLQATLSKSAVMIIIFSRCCKWLLEVGRVRYIIF